MRLTDGTYRALRRLQVFTGVVPVGLFLAFHFAVNARSVAGPAAYGSAVEGIARLPWLVELELGAIALPILAHLALGWVVTTSRQGAREPAYPTERWRWVQRACGLYLSVFVVFHVWSVRLAPERLAGQRPLFDLMAGTLAHPAVFALQALGVLAAAAHFAGGLVALGGPGGFALSSRGRARLGAAAVASFAILALTGLASLAAFVWPAARWLS